MPRFFLFQNHKHRSSNAFQLRILKAEKMSSSMTERKRSSDDENEVDGRRVSQKVEAGGSSA